MFYARINKIKAFNNREGFLGLFNRAELRRYSHVSGYSVGVAPHVPSVPPVPPLTLADPIDLDDDARRQKLLDAVLSEAGRFTQSHSLEINGVKDNQTLTFDEAGLVLYQSETIPDNLHLQVWGIESDEDVRKFALDAEKGKPTATTSSATGKRRLTVQNTIRTVRATVRTCTRQHR
jgi:hypothetical protein